MIGAVVIVGNHEVVPFHRLPNPTDDSDEDVLSDNPYSTTSGNYLSPEWPVGRLPGEKGSDPGLVWNSCGILLISTKTHCRAAIFSIRLSTLLTGRVTPSTILRDLFKKPHDFWIFSLRLAAIFHGGLPPIGTGSDLRVSPEFDSDTIDVDNLMKAKCGYFNLHGLSTTPEWYGQKDYSEDVEGPDFRLRSAWIIYRI